MTTDDSKERGWYLVEWAENAVRNALWWQNEAFDVPDYYVDPLLRKFWVYELVLDAQGEWLRALVYVLTWVREGSDG